MTSSNGETPQSVVFFDSDIPDLQDLLSGLAPGVEAFVIDPSSDGLAQMAAILAANNLGDLSSISIVGHGAAGQIQIGATSLDAGDLSNETTALARIGATLAPGGDLQLYACDIASGVIGQQFIADLSQAAGAGVAASDQEVGQIASGENWSLDATAGDVAAISAASAPFTAAALTNYQGVLGGAQVVTVGPDSSVSITTDSDNFAGVFGVAELTGAQSVLVGVSTTANDTGDGGPRDTGLQVAIIDSGVVSFVDVPMPSGTSVSADFIGGAAVTALTNGDFAVLYWGDNDSDGANSIQSGTNGNLPGYYVQEFSPNGTPVGSLITITQSSVGNEFGTIAEDPTNNGFIVGYSNGNETSAVIQRFSNSGTAGDSFAMSGLNPFNIAVDGNGNIFAQYSSESDARLYAYIPDTATSITSPGVLTGQTVPLSDNAAEPEFVGRSSGGFVGFFFDGTNLAAETTNADGTLSSEITLGDVGSTITSADYPWIAVALPGGYFALTVDPSSSENNFAGDVTGLPGTSQIIEVGPALTAAETTVYDLTDSNGSPIEFGPFAVADQHGGLVGYTDVASSFSAEGYPLDASVTAVTYLDSGLLLTAGPNVTGIEDASTGTVTVANFTDASIQNPKASDFTATVNWGDGTGTLAATVVDDNNGTFSIESAHTYVDEGQYTIGVSVSDGNNASQASDSATIADAPLTAGTATLTGGVEGVTAATLSAAFTDANSDAPTSDFSGTIAWGDGTTTNFTSAAVSGSGGSYSVSGSHTYAEEGSYAASVTITDDGGSTATDTGTATVGDAPLTAGTATLIGGVEGVTAATLSAAFTDANSAAPTSDFSGTIAWGDGTTTNFTSAAVSGSGGSYSVSGSHTYAEEGSYAASVTITDDGGSTATDTGAAMVGDAPLTAGTATLIGGVEGVTAATLSAAFTDANSDAPTSDFSGTIAWGDGTTTNFTSAAVSGSGGSYSVSGSHTYAEEGSYAASVTITDDGGSTATDTGTAMVGDAPLTAGTATLIGGVEGVTAATLSAAFTDANSDAPTSDFSGTIAWGDGTTTNFTSAAVSGSGGSYSVSGSHTYAEEGSYAASVTIRDDGGSTATDTGTAMVASDLPVVTAVAPNVSASASETFTPGQLFSASDAAVFPILNYEVEDKTSGPNQGFWVLNGAVLPNGQITTLSAVQLSQLSFVAGSASASVLDALEVAASDSAGFGPFATFTVTASVHVSSAAPVVTAANELEAPNLTLAASGLFSATAFGGSNVTSYEVEDTTADSGHWVFNGTAEPTNQFIDVTAAQLSELSFATGYGSDTLTVRANDGSQWGSFTGFTVTPPPNAAAPAGTADTLVMLRNADGAFEFYDIGKNTILLDGPLGQINPALQVAGIGGFDGTDTTDLLMRDPATGAFTLYDVSNNNITGNVALGQVGPEWTVSGVGDFSTRPGETDLLMRNSNTGAFEVYDISNNEITSSAGMGQVGLEWQVAGFGDFSGQANETDMLMRNSNTGAFEAYDISSNAITFATGMGQVGLEWQVAGFGDFSGRANETDMLMRNSNTGAFEVYDISNSTITSSTGMGQVGLEWTIAAFGDFSGNANETDMLMRNTNTGAFELYDISNNTVTLATGMGQVGMEWSVSGVSAGGISAAPGAQLSGLADDPAGASLGQLSQAMASFAPSGSATAASPIEQQPLAPSGVANLLTAPNHV